MLNIYIILFMNDLDIRKVRENLGMTQEEIAKTLGVSARTIQNYEAGGVIPRSKHEIIRSLSMAKRQHNAEPFLVTKSGVKFYELPNNLYKMRVPFVPVSAYAGYVDEFAQPQYVESLQEYDFIVKEILHGKYLSFEIKGDSMDDDTRKSIANGDVVLAREVDRDYWKAGLNLRDNDAWIIVLKNNIVCKQIIDQDLEKGVITCHSLNSSPEYSDFTLNLDDIRQLLNITIRVSVY